MFPFLPLSFKSELRFLLSVSFFQLNEKALAQLLEFVLVLQVQFLVILHEASIPTSNKVHTIHKYEKEEANLHVTKTALEKHLKNIKIKVKTLFPCGILPLKRIDQNILSFSILRSITTTSTCL